jgi:hypothetical protein
MDRRVVGIRKGQDQEKSYLDREADFINSISMAEMHELIHIMGRYNEYHR